MHIEFEIILGVFTVIGSILVWLYKKSTESVKSDTEKEQRIQHLEKNYLLLVKSIDGLTESIKEHNNTSNELMKVLVKSEVIIEGILRDNNKIENQIADLYNRVNKK